MNQDESAAFKPHTIFVGTFNVNNRSPKEQLKEWLSADSVPPDFYVIGFQELGENKHTSKQEWLEATKAALNSSVSYKMVTLIRLFGIVLIIFVKEELSEFVSNVATATVKTGLGENFATKGCVAVRLEFHSSSMCFINCHFTPHLEECDARNENYNYILSQLSFKEFKSPKYIGNHDHVYWLGDLNYRIDLNCEAVKSLVEKKLYTVLLKSDQLTTQKMSKNIFNGFKEGTIDFPPTYKYDVGSNNWDSEKNRIPSWCDRILWKGDNISLVQYRSHPIFTLSDHKPVSALFSFEVKTVDIEKQPEKFQNVRQDLDIQE